jgi:hypothetical protein
MIPEVCAGPVGLSVQGVSSQRECQVSGFLVSGSLRMNFGEQLHMQKSRKGY